MRGPGAGRGLRALHGRHPARALRARAGRVLYCTVTVLCTELYCALLLQVLAWAVLMGSVPASLVATPPSHQQRSPFLCLALLAAYNLLSLSYEVREALFFCLFNKLFNFTLCTKYFVTLTC